MRRFLILLILMTLVSLDNCKTKTNPYRIHVEGKVSCRNKRAYAVLLNVFEEITYIRYGGEMSGVLRTGNYFLSDHDGRFHVTGTRYAIDHKIYLNITHHCIPTAKRDIHKNCFMQVKHEIEGDPKRVHYEVHEIHLETTQYQSNDVRCVDWPYKYPKLDKIAHHDL